MWNACEKNYSAGLMPLSVHMLIQGACLCVCLSLSLCCGFLLMFCWSSECGVVQNRRIVFKIGNVFGKLSCEWRERRRHGLRTAFGRPRSALFCLFLPCSCVCLWISDPSTRDARTLTRDARTLTRDARTLTRDARTFLDCRLERDTWTNEYDDSLFILMKINQGR